MKYNIISFLLVVFSPVTAQINGRLADTVKFGNTGIEVPVEHQTYNLSEVSVTAYHNPEKFMSVAGAVSILPVDSIQYAGYNIVSSLGKSPGLIIQEATPGTMKMTLRGIGSRYPYGTKKIKMFFDGIPLYSAEGETYFDDINPDYLSRIEILRGPASSIYGASLGGAVVLYPKKSEYGQSDLCLLSSAGSFGYLKNTLTYSDNGGKNDILISYSGVRSDGYRENSNYLRNSMMLNFNHRIRAKLTGELLLSASLINAQIPSSIDSSTFVSDPASAAPAWLRTKGKKEPGRILTGYKINYHPSKDWDIISSFFFTFRENEENRPFNFLNESGASYGGRVLARYVRNSGTVDYKVTAGSNLFFENYNSSLYENPGGMGIKGDLMQKGSEFLYQTDLFSQLEVNISKFTFTGGFNLNKSGFLFTDQFSNDTINQSGSYSFDPVFSPRISVSWQPVSRITTYAAINHGFTIPSLSETMTPAGLINQDIRPEKAWSYEAGARFELFRKRSFIDLALYYMKVSDLIVPKRVEEDFYVGMNAGASLHKGIELSLQQWLWGKRETDEKARSSAVVNLSYSLNSFSFLEFTEGANDFSGNQLPGIPENNFSGSIFLEAAHGFFSQIEIVSSGKIPLNDFNSSFTDPWVVMNARAGFTVPVKKRWVLSAMAGLNNVTDTRYASMVVVNAPGTAERPPRYYYPGMPRWVTVSLGVKYRFLKD